MFSSGIVDFRFNIEDGLPIMYKFVRKKDIKIILLKRIRKLYVIDPVTYYLSGTYCRH